MSDEPTDDTHGPRGGTVHRSMAKGAAWLIFARFAARGIGLLSTLVMARLLVPADFGLMAMATTLMAAVEVMAEFNFELVLIRDQTAGRAHYDTVWTLTILRGLVLGGLMVALAHPAAAYFNEPRLAVIVSILAANTVLMGFANVGIVDFQKELQFHKDFVYMLSVRLASFVVVVVLGFLWRNYWALVAGMLTTGIARFVLSYAMHPYRPRLSLAVWREVFSFSKWLVINNVINFIYHKTDTFFLAKLAGAQVVGVYSVAYEVSNTATTELVAPIRRAIFPGYARLAADSTALRKSYVDVLALTLVLTLPVAAGVGLVADPLVRVVLGLKWLAAIPLLHILALYGIVSLTWSNMSPLFLAINKPRQLTWFVTFGAIIVVPLLYFGVHAYGAIGAAWAVTISNAAMLFIGMALTLRYLALSLGALIVAIWRPFAAAAIMGGIVLAVQAGWPAAHDFASDLGELLACAAAGATTYVAALLGLWKLVGAPPGPERTVLGTLRGALGRMRRRLI